MNMNYSFYKYLVINIVKTNRIVINYNSIKLLLIRLLNLEDNE